MEKAVQHPVVKTGGKLVVIGVAGALMSGSLGAFGVSGPLPAGAAAGSLLLATFGGYLMVLGPVVTTINRAINTLQLGQLDEAGRLLREAEACRGERFFRRPIRLVEGQLLLHAGDVDGALAAFDLAARQRVSFLGGFHAKAQQTQALAYVALLRAGKGETALAKVAITAVRTGTPLGASLARAAVAELVLQQREGDTAAMRATLEKNRSLLFEATSPQERALVRALERSLEVRPASAYRDPAERRPLDDASALRDWVGKVAPEAAAHVTARGAPLGENAEIRFAAPSAEATAWLERDRKETQRAPRRAVYRVFFLWGLLVAMFLAVYNVLTPTGTKAPPPTVAPESSQSGSDLDLVVLTTIFGLILVGAVTARRRASRRYQAAVRAAAVALAQGDHPLTRRLVTPWLSSKLALQRAEALLLLAYVEERDVHLAAALAACDQALKAASERVSAAGAFDLVLPAIHAERAFLLAALGREGDSTAEIHRLETEYPSYALRGNAELRVKLTQLTRAGAHAEAAVLSRGRSAYMGLGRREETLLDLVDARDAADGGEELAHLQKQIDRDPPLTAWLTEVAPKLMSELCVPAQPRAATS